MHFEPLVSQAAMGEAYGNLRQRNQFATLLNISGAAVLWRAAMISDASNRPNFGRLAVFLTMALLAVANAASSSRTGLLQLFFLAVLGFSWGRNTSSTGEIARRNLVLQTALVGLVYYSIALFALPLLIGLDPKSSGILARLHEGGGCQSRLVLWSNVLHLIAQKPWLGWGWGELGYAHFMTLYPGERFCDILDNAHNLPLHLAFVWGIPASLLLCGGTGWLVWRLKPWREANATRQLAWTVLALIGLHSLLEYPLWYGPFQLAVALCIFLLWRVPAEVHAVASNAIVSDTIRFAMPSPRVAQAARAVALLVLVGCAYAGWDYWRVSQIYTDPEDRASAYREDTLQKIQGSWLFQRQVRFAELSITPLTKDNAEHIHDLALDMLHFSPEAQVAKSVIESARLLGRDDEVAFYEKRLRAAFPNNSGGDASAVKN